MRLDVVDPGEERPRGPAPEPGREDLRSDDLRAVIRNPGLDRASKAAVVSLTRNLAREWGPKNIRVNALSPGFFPAEQNRKVLTPDRVAKVMAHTPMARFGSPEELAGAVVLMAAPRAGSFLTGANIYVDGGFTAQTI